MRAQLRTAGTEAGTADRATDPASEPWIREGPTPALSKLRSRSPALQARALE